MRSLDQLAEELINGALARAETYAQDPITLVDVDRALRALELERLRLDSLRERLILEARPPTGGEA